MFLEFAKFGCFTFGGGWSIIAQMQQYYVDKRKEITSQELLDLASVAKSLPGTMIANVAMLYGYRAGGPIGGFLCVFGMVFPPMVILIAISFFYRTFRSSYWVMAAMEGMQAAEIPGAIAANLGVLTPSLTLCAVAYAYSWNAANPDSALKGATAIFGGGIAGMIDPNHGSVYSVLYTLLVLTYSSFCLTSLDTATRLARFMFQEFWLDGSKGETPDNVTGYKKVLSNPYVATVITVVLGVLLGLNGYGKIWALFGSANQLLAALGLLAVATWLSNIGKDNKMFLLPMAFMLCVTIASLFINTKTQIGNILKGGADWGPWAQVILGVLLIVLALVLAVEGVSTIVKDYKKAKANA